MDENKPDDGIEIVDWLWIIALVVLGICIVLVAATWTY